MITWTQWRTGEVYCSYTTKYYIVLWKWSRWQSELEVYYSPSISQQTTGLIHSISHHFNWYQSLPPQAEPQKKQVCSPALTYQIKQLNRTHHNIWSSSLAHPYWIAPEQIKTKPNIKTRSHQDIPLPKPSSPCSTNRKFRLWNILNMRLSLLASFVKSIRWNIIPLSQ